MDLKQIEALKQSIREWKSIGHSNKYPMPIATAEQLIAAAEACKRIPHVLKEAVR